MEMSGQLHYPAVLTPVKTLKGTEQEARWAPEPGRMFCKRDKSLALCVVADVDSTGRSLSATPATHPALLMWKPVKKNCLEKAEEQQENIRLVKYQHGGRENINLLAPELFFFNFSTSCI